MELKCTPESEARVYRDIGHLHTALEVFQRLPEVECPVVVACGGDAAWNKFAFLARAAPALAERLPQQPSRTVRALGC